MGYRAQNRFGATREKLLRNCRLNTGNQCKQFLCVITHNATLRSLCYRFIQLSLDLEVLREDCRIDVCIDALEGFKTGFQTDPFLYRDCLAGFRARLFGNNG